MKSKERAVRIAITSLLVVFALLSISQSGYGFMHSIIRHDERMEALWQMGMESGGRAVLIIVLAFLVQFSWAQFKRSRLIQIALVMGVIAFAYPQLNKWQQVTACQQSGGQWDPRIFACGET